MGQMYLAGVVATMAAFIIVLGGVSWFTRSE